MNEIGISKSELLNHYYIDEIGEIVQEYNLLIEGRNESQTKDGDIIDPNQMTAEDMTQFFMGM